MSHRSESGAESSNDDASKTWYMRHHTTLGQDKDKTRQTFIETMAAKKLDW